MEQESGKEFSQLFRNSSRFRKLLPFLFTNIRPMCLLELSPSRAICSKFFSQRSLAKIDFFRAARRNFPRQPADGGKILIEADGSSCLC